MSLTAQWRLNQPNHATSVNLHLLRDSRATAEERDREKNDDGVEISFRPSHPLRRRHCHHRSRNHALSRARGDNYALSTWNPTSTRLLKGVFIIHGMIFKSCGILPFICESSKIGTSYRRPANRPAFLAATFLRGTQKSLAGLPTH